MSKKHGRIGPQTLKPEQVCAGCRYLHGWCGMTDFYAECEHPQLKGQPRRIGSYDRGHDGGVPVPRWCPVVKAALLGLDIIDRHLYSPERRAALLKEEKT